MTDPLASLAVDRERARELQDPCAGLCTLANVDAAGYPDARTLVLRELEGRLAVFVNATSPKFTALGRVSVVVWLPSLNLQYRLRAETSAVPSELVAESWQFRPDAPKRMDWLYALRQPQSSEIADRATLLETLEALPLPDPLVAPDSAQGLYLEVAEVDRLDLNQANGVHDRRRYWLNGGRWHEAVLVP